MTNSIEKKDIAISVNNIKKTFRLPHENASGLKQVLVNIFNKNKKSGFEKQQVLDGISFDVHKGDFFGVVGRNGSGKSTLLKLLAGIYVPDSGSITTNGSIVPFIELGVGFNHELTGKENVYMNGALLGFSRKEMEAMYDDIVEFAELERFMDQKLKNYSSGMQVRLAFSIAIKAQGDILILDEVLAVGDEAFQRKCNDFFAKVKKDKSKTIILVTHSMDAVKKYCNRAVMIRDGEIAMIGSPDDVANEYSLENIQTPIVADRSKAEDNSIVEDFKVDILSKKQISQNDKIKIRISYKTSVEAELFTILSLQDLKRNAPVFDSLSKFVKSKAGERVVWDAEIIPTDINDAEFRIHAQVRNKDNSVLGWVVDEQAPLILFKRSDYDKKLKTSRFGIVVDKTKWSTPSGDDVNE